MKYRTLRIIAGIVCSFLVSCANGPILGGYTKAPVTDPEVRAAAQFAISAQSKASSTSNEPQTSILELASIVRAERQIVAGTNYSLALRVKQGGKERAAEVVVFQSLQPIKYELTFWNWK
jgi:hypothetical protein